MYGDGLTSRRTRYTENGSTGSTRSNRWDEHDLKDVAFEDVLLRRVDRGGPLRVVQIRADVRHLGELVGGRQRGHVRQRLPELGHRVGEASHRGVVAAPQGRVVAPRLGVHVLDQEATLAEVVERGDLPGERTHRVGQPEVVVRHVGQRSISRTVS